MLATKMERDSKFGKSGAGFAAVGNGLKREGSMRKALFFVCFVNPTPAPGRSPHGSHRPTGLALAADFSLFLTDDTGGTIWRISYRRNPR